jgi:hypothetical protein
MSFAESTPSLMTAKLPAMMPTVILSTDSSPFPTMPSQEALAIRA